MYWIMGAEEIAHAIFKLQPVPVFGVLYQTSSQHPEWNGFHFYDLIFPCFYLLQA